MSGKYIHTRDVLTNMPYPKTASPSTDDEAFHSNSGLPGNPKHTGDCPQARKRETKVYLDPGSARSFDGIYQSRDTPRQES